MKNKILTGLSVILACMIMAGISVGIYQPVPIVKPNGVQFDPNATPYDIYCAEYIWVGRNFHHQFYFTEPEGEPITVTATLVTITGITQEVLLGGAIRYKVEYDFMPITSGVFYPVFTASDTFVNTVHASIALNAKQNTAPVPGGCRVTQ